MITWTSFSELSPAKKVKTIYEMGNFIVAIRYYKYKVNLYQLGDEFIEVFIDHKTSTIEKIMKLDTAHSRMHFYCDQIKIELF